MDAALASHLGAFVGGSTVATSNFALDTVRAKRERATKAQEDQTQSRRAARLMANKLESARRLLSRDLQADAHSWEPPDRHLPTGIRNEYRASLAHLASGTAWAAVATVYAKFDELHWHLLAVIEEDHWTGAGPQHPMESRAMGPRTRELFTNGLDAVDHALETLRDLLEEEK